MRAWRRAVRLLGWPLRMLFLGAVHLYRATLGPIFAGRCRFYPSCSNYALQSFRVHGPLKGLVLAAWRLLRCTPLSPGGIDPVPPEGAWRAPQPADVR